MRKITPILFGLVVFATSTPMTALAVPVTASKAATFAAAATNEQATPIYYRRGHRVVRRNVYRGAYYGGYRRSYYAGNYGYGGYYSPYAYSYPYGYSSYGRSYYRW
jgi:hypothetical protein